MIRKGVLALVRRDGKYLLVHKVRDTAFPYWGFPKGGLKEGEAEEEALMRELREEIGTDNVSVLKKLEQRFERDWNTEYKSKWRSNTKGKWTGCSYAVFVCDFAGSDDELVAEPEICDGIKWFTVDEVREKARPDMAELLQRFKILRLL